MKSNSNTVWFNFFRRVTKIWQLKKNIYIYVWKLNQTVLELDLWTDKFLFFPRQDLNSHHWYTAAPIA